MKRFLFIFALLIAFSLLHAVQVEAQTVTVSGIVYKSGTMTTIPSVNVSYTINNQNFVSASDENGEFSFTIPKGTNTLVKFSCVGFQPQSKTINAYKNTKDLKINLLESAAEIPEIVITQRVPLISQKNDTLFYNLKNIHTNPDANAEDILRRLNGVTVSGSQIQALGHNVSEIRLDGKEFFKYDLSMALKNLPKDILAGVKVYEELSDYAKLNGIDDGSKTTIIDFTTKSGSEGTNYGKTSGGYGTDDRYSLYGFYIHPDKRNRYALFTQWNNTNDQNFSTIDLLSVTGAISSDDPTKSPFSKNAISNSYSFSKNEEISSMMTALSNYGVTKTTAAGVEYDGESKNGKLKYSGHYLFNISDNNTLYNIYDEYFGETNYNNRQYQNLDNRNLNHRFNFKLEYQISPKDFMLLRPSFVFQNRKQNSYLTDWTVNKSDSLQNNGANIYDGSIRKDSLMLNQHTQTDQDAYSTNNELAYNHKFNNGHSFSVDAKFSYTNTNEDMNLEIANQQSSEYILQNTASKNNSKTYSAIVTYKWPINKYHTLKFDAGWTKVMAHIKQATETNVNHAETFKIDSMLCGRANTYYGGTLANINYLYNYKYWNVNVGSEFRNYKLWTENDRETVTYNFDTQILENIDGKRTVNKLDDQLWRKFLPYLYIHYQHNKTTWDLQYKANQLYPTVYQLLEAINNTNSIMSFKGNNRLQPSYNHNMSTRIMLTNKERGTHFDAHLSFEIVQNYIGSKRSLSSTSWANDARHRNSEMYTYVNVPDTTLYWSALGGMAYGFLINPLKTHVNVNTMVLYCSIPGYWDKDLLFNKQWNWNGNIVFASDVSDRIDFVLNINGNYNSCSNMAYNKMDVAYWSLEYGAQVKWLITEHMPLTVECGRTNYFGSGTSQFNAVIANISLGYKFLKKKNAELGLICHDIFNQDNSFLQTTTELYRRQMTTSLLKRYFMLKFTYKFNTCKKESIK